MKKCPNCVHRGRGNAEKKVCFFSGQSSLGMTRSPECASTRQAGVTKDACWTLSTGEVRGIMLPEREGVLKGKVPSEMEVAPHYYKLLVNC